MTVMKAAAVVGVPLNASFARKELEGGATAPAPSKQSNGRDADPSDPGDGVTQADIDSGVPGCTVNDIADSSWHGTQTAGLIGAATNNAVGMASVGRDIRLLPVRVLAASLPAGASRPVGVGALPDISSGLKIAIDLGAHVLNLSFGTAESDVDPHGPLPHADVVAYAESNGCTLVAASGNSGRAERYYPAALPHVVPERL